MNLPTIQLYNYKNHTGFHVKKGQIRSSRVFDVQYYLDTLQPEEYSKYDKKNVQVQDHRDPAVPGGEEPGRTHFHGRGGRLPLKIHRQGEQAPAQALRASRPSGTSQPDFIQSTVLVLTQLIVDSS